MRSLASAPSAVATPATFASDAKIAWPRDARTERGNRCRVAFLPKPAAWGFQHARDVVLNGGT
jgi:hypothetical protein